MAVAAGSVVVLNAHSGEGADASGTRVGFNGATGAQIQSCGFVEYTGYENHGGAAWSVPNGRFVIQSGAILNLYSSTGVRSGVVTDLDADAVFTALIVGVNDSGSTYWIAGWDFNTALTLFRLWVGQVNATTGAVTGTHLVDTVANDAILGHAELYPVAADVNGVLYYVKGSNVSPAAATHALKRADIPTGAILGTTVTYGVGTAYPCDPGSDRTYTSHIVLPNTTQMVANYTTSADLSVTTLYLITLATGATAFDYTTAGDAPGTPIFLNTDSVSFWDRNGDVTFIERRVSDGVTLTTVDATSLYLGHVSAYVARAEYSGCGVYAAPPAPPDPIPLPGSGTAGNNWGTSQAMRRVRRFPHVASGNLRWVFFPGLQVDIESGVGASTGQGSDPQMFLRVSKDGGHTWSTERWAGMGAMGQYRYRARWLRLGRARDWVFEIAQTDPVKTVWLQAVADPEPEEGLS